MCGLLGQDAPFFFFLPQRFFTLGAYRWFCDLNWAVGLHMSAWFGNQPARLCAVDDCSITFPLRVGVMIIMIDQKKTRTSYSETHHHHHRLNLNSVRETVVRKLQHRRGHRQIHGEGRVLVIALLFGIGLSVPNPSHSECPLVGQVNADAGGPARCRSFVWRPCEKELVPDGTM